VGGVCRQITRLEEFSFYAPGIGSYNSHFTLDAGVKCCITGLVLPLSWSDYALPEPCYCDRWFFVLF
jgi:hypothetical protein